MPELSVKQRIENISESDISETDFSETDISETWCFADIRFCIIHPAGSRWLTLADISHKLWEAVLLSDRIRVCYPEN